AYLVHQWNNVRIAPFMLMRQDKATHPNANDTFADTKIALRAAQRVKSIALRHDRTGKHRATRSAGGKHC
ncbi:hypothetical protein QM999_09315, partial [Pectobacterium cacticida]|uniref:hypothetical protein n=1 Tax=Pectobacterium cacticida TaxID=69221 RepID=UPI002FF0238E